MKDVAYFTKRTQDSTKIEQENAAEQVASKMAQIKSDWENETGWAKSIIAAMEDAADNDKNCAMVTITANQWNFLSGLGFFIVEDYCGGLSNNGEQIYSIEISWPLE